MECSSDSLNPTQRTDQEIQERVVPRVPCFLVFYLFQFILHLKFDSFVSCELWFVLKVGVERSFSLSPKHIETPTFSFPSVFTLSVLMCCIYVLHLDVLFFVRYCVLFSDFLVEPGIGVRQPVVRLIVSHRQIARSENNRCTQGAGKNIYIYV